MVLRLPAREREKERALGDVSRRCISKARRCPRQMSSRSRRALEYFSHVFIPRVELVLMRGEMARDEAQRGVAVPKLRDEPALPHTP